MSDLPLDETGLGDEQIIHIPAACEGEFDVPRSVARMEIDLGWIYINGRKLNPGEHDLALEDCLDEANNECHLERRSPLPRSSVVQAESEEE